MPAAPNPLAPDEQLATTIAEALWAAGLVPTARLEEVKQKLSAGTAREADWRAWVEEGLDG